MKIFFVIKTHCKELQEYFSSRQYAKNVLQIFERSDIKIKRMIEIYIDFLYSYFIFFKKGKI